VLLDAVELKLVGRDLTTSYPSYLSVIRSVPPPDFKYGRLQLLSPSSIVTLKRSVLSSSSSIVAITSYRHHLFIEKGFTDIS
jgi:hypothetical protein